MLKSALYVKIDIGLIQSDLLPVLNELDLCARHHEVYLQRFQTHSPIQDLFFSFLSCRQLVGDVLQVQEEGALSGAEVEEVVDVEHVRVVVEGVDVRVLVEEEFPEDSTERQVQYSLIQNASRDHSSHQLHILHRTCPDRVVVTLLIRHQYITLQKATHYQVVVLQSRS